MERFDIYQINGRIFHFLPLFQSYLFRFAIPLLRQQVEVINPTFRQEGLKNFEG